MISRTSRAPDQLSHRRFDHLRSRRCRVQLEASCNYSNYILDGWSVTRISWTHRARDDLRLFYCPQENFLVEIYTCAKDFMNFPRHQLAPMAALRQEQDWPSSDWFCFPARLYDYAWFVDSG